MKLHVETRLRCRPGQSELKLRATTWHYSLLAKQFHVMSKTVLNQVYGCDRHYTRKRTRFQSKLIVGVTDIDC